MFHIHIKPQNRSRIFLIFLLGGIWGIIDVLKFEGVFDFLLDGGIMFFVCIGLGNLTRIALEKLEIPNPFKTQFKENNILDDSRDMEAQQSNENQKDTHALNYAIFWVIFFLIISF